MRRPLPLFVALVAVACGDAPDTDAASHTDATVREWCPELPDAVIPGELYVCMGGTSSCVPDVRISRADDRAVQIGPFDAGECVVECARGGWTMSVRASDIEVRDDGMWNSTDPSWQWEVGWCGR